MSKHSAIDISVKTERAPISVVHPSFVDVGSVAVDTSARIPELGGNVFTRYPPLKTTSPAKQGAVELATKSPDGAMADWTTGPVCL